MGLEMEVEIERWISELWNSEEEGVWKLEVQVPLDISSDLTSNQAH